MEKILIDWISEYIGIPITMDSKFQNLNFDLFDEAIVVDFVQKTFNVNVNIREDWFDTVKDLIDEIAKRTNTHA
jgi:acyl carrier protein